MDVILDDLSVIFCCCAVLFFLAVLDRLMMINEINDLGLMWVN